MIKHLYKLIVISTLLVLSVQCWSQSPTTQGGSESHWGNFLNQWDIAVAFGYGQRSNPLIESEAIETIVNIDISWYGERLFFDNGDIGYNLIYRPNFRLNAIGLLTNEQVFFGKTNRRFINIGGDSLVAGSGEPPRGEGEGRGSDDPSTNQLEEIKIPDRDYAYESGLEAIVLGKWGQLQMSASTDVTGTHEGQRLSASYTYNHLWKRWHIQPGLAISWKSRALTDYYFGVREHEATRVFGAYEAGASVTGKCRVLFNYAITQDLFWGTALEYQYLDSAIADSTIIKQNHVLTSFTGLKYRF